MHKLTDHGIKPLKEKASLTEKRHDEILSGQGYFIEAKAVHSLTDLQPGTISIVVRAPDSNKDPKFYLGEGAKPNETSTVEMSNQETREIL